MTDHAWVEWVRREVVGIDTGVPTFDGRTVPYVSLDNAASTPALRAVRDTVTAFMDWYSSVHRGAGFKSRVATHWYEDARRTVIEHVGGDPSRHVAVFVRNTTEGLNVLAQRLLTSRVDGAIVTSAMEHHSNLLPWRRSGRVVHVDVDDTGAVHPDVLERVLAEAGRVAAVAVSGASNVTGFVPPLGRLAAIAHGRGALFIVDGAQLVPHRRVRLGDAGDPERIDALVWSGHKMYAPYGAGVIVADRALFEHGDPLLVGGGMVRSVTLEDADWADSPDADEGGSPNVVGVVALAAAVRAMRAFGLDAIERHEDAVTAYALQRLSTVRGLTVYGPREAGPGRLGVFTFNLDAAPHGLVAAVLGHEHGIGVRNGCFCAHPLMYRLLCMPKQAVDQFRNAMRLNVRNAQPGAVRASLGLYNTADDVDALVRALRAIAAGKIAGDYIEDRATGDYVPAGPDAATAAFDPAAYLPRPAGQMAARAHTLPS
jgi:selenocysteine lyase/cysteine desulfurase